MSQQYERQKLRSEDEELRLGLDAELKDLRMMLGGSARIPRPSASATVDKVATDEAGAAGESDDDSLDEDEDEEGDSDGDSEENGSDEEEELDEAGLEAALSAAGKAGVDRDLLRKLIGKLAADEPSDDEQEEPEPLSTALPIASTSTERPAPAEPLPKDDDPYDSYVRMLALEPRAHATDRLKTPLELAQDAAKALREQEEARLKRQRGEEEGDEDKAGKKGKRKPQGDDLDDDFLMEGEGSEFEDEGLGKGLEGGFGAQVIEDISEDEDEDEEGDEDEDEESGDDESETEENEDLGFDDMEDDVEEEGETGALESLVVSDEPAVTGPRPRQASGKAELPFTFPCPTTHTEFTTLLATSGIAEADTATVVKRIRVLYHPGLGEANKGKLQVSVAVASYSSS